MPIRAAVRKVATRASARPRWIDVIVALLLASIAFSFVSTIVSRHLPLSPIDEYMYIDYASKVPIEGFVRQGDTIDDTARQYASCLGVQVFGFVGDCANRTVDANFPYGAKTISAVHPPTYFWTVWYGSEAFATLGITDRLDAMRMTGALYLALGVVGLFALARLVGAARLPSAGFALLIAASPSVHWATAYVSNDAPALALSSLVLILAVLAFRRHVSSWWLVPAAALTASFKVQFAGVLGLLTLFLILMLVGSRFSWMGTTLDHFQRARRMLLPMLASLAAAGAVVVGWNYIRIENAVAVDAATGIATPLTLGAILLEAINFLPGAITQTGGVPIGSIVQAVSTVGGWLLIAGLLASTIRNKGGSTEGVMRVGSLSVTLSFVILGPALVLVILVGSGAYYLLPPRYGLTLVPALVAVGAAYWSRAGLIPHVLIVGLGVVEIVALVN